MSPQRLRFCSVVSRHRLPCPRCAPFPELTQYRQGLTHNALTTDHPRWLMPTRDFSSAPSLTVAALCRRRRPLLSGGASLLQQGHAVLSASEDAWIRQTVSMRPADSLTLAQRHHIQCLSSSAQETAHDPAIWGIAGPPPSRISSGQLREQKLRAVNETFGFMY